jgi:prevent-host-death family protein
MTTELVTSLKRRATKIISQIQRKKEPVLITQRGLPAAYLVGVKEFEALQYRLQVLEGIALGERDLREGRILTHEQAKKRLRKWLK